MTKNQAKQCIRALQLAKKIIADGKERYICVALVNLWMSEKISLNTGFLVRKYIHNQLGSSTSLEDWLEVKGYGRDLSLIDFKYKVRETRLKWIDYMIEQYKEIK